MTKQSLPKGRFSVSLREVSAVELFKVTDPWTTQSLSEVLVNKYGRGALETKSRYQVFLSDKRLTAQQMDDLVFCSASTQGSILLAVLAAVDAAFSGDWSRIGAISKDTELWLQSALGLLGIWHLLMGASAYSIAEQNGRPKLLVTIKALAVGTIPVLELMLDIQTALD